MSMVVQHNLSAMNTNRQLGVTTSDLSKSTEKLSSGYRINRAGDDAAGLKISEKMRSQIRGLDKASSNAQDGISLIQTAEGALNESHSILQRMNELAVQGANDTNESIDRDAINQELTALTTELDRIASTTQFNKQNLLDGNFTGKKLQIGANTNQNIAITIDAMNASAIGITAERSVSYKLSLYVHNSVGYSTSALALAAYAASIEAVGAATATTKASVIAGASTAIYKIGTDYYVGGASTKYSTAAKAATYLATKHAASKITTSTSTVVKTVTAPTVSDYEKANATLSKIQNAINNVSEQRSALGALQNRLEHTIANLDTSSENASAAESRIRDTDMAKEMVTYSKNNILAQAGQSMLAQANQSTQGVLSLLQ